MGDYGALEFPSLTLRLQYDLTSLYGDRQAIQFHFQPNKNQKIITSLLFSNNLPRLQQAGSAFFDA